MLRMEPPGQSQYSFVERERESDLYFCYYAMTHTHTHTCAAVWLKHSIHDWLYQHLSADHDSSMATLRTAVTLHHPSHVYIPFEGHG